MKLSYTISRFRSIVDKQTIELDSEKINILIGQNGTGKSNVLDAIRWFSGHTIDNIKTIKTENHPKYDINNLYLDAPEVLYLDELDESEKNNVIKKLQEINIDYKVEKLTRYFGKYKDLFYKNLNLNSLGLTDLSKIKKVIYDKFSNFWPNSIFSLNKNNYWELNTNLLDVKDEIMNSTKKGVNKDIKDILCKAIDVWIEIENIFKYRPNILFSNNLENDNNILFEYEIQSIKNKDSINKEFKMILDMLGEDIFDIIEKIIDLSTSDSNRILIRTLKDKVIKQSKTVFQNIFKSFSINVMPEITIDDQKFQIVIRSDENRHYATYETKEQNSGFKSFLWLIIMLEVLKKWDKVKWGRVILLLDEPDKNLHILLQYQVAKYLEENFKEKNNVFILLTSHSPFLVPSLDENIYITHLEQAGNTKILKADKVKNIRHYGIFPLITLEQTNSLKKILFPELNKNEDEDFVSIYYNAEKKDIIKIENELDKIINNKFKYRLVALDANDSKHIFSNDFFVAKFDKLHLLMVEDNYRYKKDIFLTENFINHLLSTDMLPM